MTNPDLVIMLVASYRVVIDRLLAGHIAAGLGEIRPIQGFVIRAVAAESPTINRLAEMLDTSKQFASKLADAMVKEGYLERGSIAGDRRSRRLRLSDKGARVRNSALRTSTKIEKELEGAVGAHSLKTFRRTLLGLLEANGALAETLAQRARPVW